MGFGGGLTWAACAIKWGVPTDEPEAGWWKSRRRQAGYQAAAARSMWRKAVRWVYQVWPNDPEGFPPENGVSKERAAPPAGPTHNN